VEMKNEARNPKIESPSCKGEGRSFCAHPDTATTKTAKSKAAEDSRTPRRCRVSPHASLSRQVLECGCPLPRSNAPAAMMVVSGYARLFLEFRIFSGFSQSRLIFCREFHRLTFRRPPTRSLRIDPDVFVSCPQSLGDAYLERLQSEIIFREIVDVPA